MVETSGEILLPALFTRTSSELLGRRPLPHVLRERPILFVLGPRGAGKSTVARALLGNALGLVESSFRSAVVAAARNRSWSRELREVRSLLFDEVDCLHDRDGVHELLGLLLRERAAKGLRTVLCQGGESDTSVTLLYPRVAPALRATVLLRFPVGRGRRQHVQKRCLARELPYALARGAVVMEPWNYSLVEAHLDAVAASAVAP
jgi:adenylate kinase family enzyme